MGRWTVNDGSEFNPDVEFEDIGEDADEDLDDDFDDDIDPVRKLKARGREALSDVADVGKRRLASAANRSKERLAERLEDTASQIDGRLFYGAEYLRTTDLEVMRDDLIDLVRRRPLLSAGIAIGAGYLIGKALGIGSGGPKRSKRGSSIKSQVGRAVVSSLAAMAAARFRAGLLESDEDEEEEEVRPKRRQPPRMRPRSSRARTRAEYE